MTTRPSSVPLVSLIILNHNGEGYLRRTLEPITRLSFPNLECLLVDNGSTDRSLEIAQHFPQFRVIKNGENFGTSRGRNIGAQAATGEYIFFLDNDILIQTPDILERLVEFYESLSNPAFLNVILIDEEALASTKTIYYGGYYGLFGICKNRPMTFESLRQYPVIETANSFTGALFVKTSTWRQLGGFDESQPFNLDDDDISLRAKILGFRNYTYTQIFAIHLGKIRRLQNEAFRWKFRYYFSGKMSPVLKYFHWSTVAKITPLFFLSTTLKTLVNLIYRRDVKLLGAFMYSIGFCVRQLPYTLKQRTQYQHQRKTSDHAVLSLRPPWTK